jgi:hypothetical protein
MCLKNRSNLVESRRQRRLNRSGRRRHREQEPADDVSRFWDAASRNDLNDELGYEDLLAISQLIGEVKSPGLSQVEVDLLSFHRAKSTDLSDCSICLSQIVFGVCVIRLSCHHLFHSSCLRCWLLKRACCPVCREVVPHPIVEINE